MKTRHIGNGSVLVTDDAAEHAERQRSGAGNPIYDPSPLPDMSGVSFSREHKQAALNLIKPDHTGK
jgi:hypothetical protein